MSQLAKNGIETSNGVGGGYSLTFPASTTPHTVYLFLGGRSNFPTLTASLSDGSAPNYINNSLGASSGPFNVMFVLTYAAAGSGQTLTVTYTMSNNASDVTLDGAAYGTVAPASGGLISGAVTTQTTQTNNLTSLGPTDWAEWGYISGSGPTPANVKNGGGNTIGAQAIDSNVTQFSGAAVSVSWTNGTPNASGTEATGIYTSSGDSGDGFMMTFPADTNLRTLYIICGGYINVGQLGVTLTDGSAPEYLDASQSSGGGSFYSLYTITYKAASAGQSLIVSWVQLNAGTNVTLSGAAYAVNALCTATCLTVAGTSANTAVNLTSEGTADWIHWGDTVPNRKAGVTPQIGNYTSAGGGQVFTYSNDPRPVGWTDGTPTASSAGNENGIYVAGVGQGFSFTAPASTTVQTLLVHVGGWYSGGTLTASLSDGSAANFVDVTAAVNGQYDRNYTIMYAARSAGQLLTVSWVQSSGTGNVTLNAAALAGTPVGSAPVAGSIAVNGGTPQSTTVSTAFATPLQALVRDTNGNPLGGATVTFAAPASGAGASFATGSTAMAVTNSSGVATAPTLTAGAQAGSYAVTASVAGVTATASFNLTNIAASTPTPGSVTANAGTPQSTTVGTLFGIALQALVRDNNGNPYSGATVTFTAPGSGAGAAFSGSATATAVTNSNGIASAPALTANSQTGSYAVTATVTGVSTPANFALTNTAAGGVSGASLVQQAAGANLGNNANTLTVTLPQAPSGSDVLVLIFDQIGASQTINSITGANWTRVGQNTSGGDLEIWTGTNPGSSSITITGTNYFGGFQPGYAIVAEFSGINATPDGFAVTTAGGSWPATTGTLATTNASDLLMTAVLSYNGGGTEAAVSSGWTPLAAPSGTFSLAAAYRFVNTTGSQAATWIGNGTPQAPTIILGLKAPGISSITIGTTAGTPQGTSVGTAFSTSLQATVMSSGSPASGASVTFTAPGSGASATFSGSATATVTTNASGVATAPAITANAQAGSYTVTATVVGASAPASFSLTNNAGVAAIVSATAGTPQSTTVSTAFSTAPQVSVKDSYANPVNGATVTFTAPGSGASAAFSGSATATAVTNSNGIATAPALTANSQTGTYTVTATVAGVSTTANFALTNTATAPGFYVSSVNGNDSWSGTLPSPNSNNSDGPFLTLTRAQSAMRTSSNKTTFIRAGTYYPKAASGLGCLWGGEAAINLVAADSGETWSYYPPDGVGTAILDGGAPAVTQSGTAPQANGELACAFAADALAPASITNVAITGLQFQNWYYSALAVNSNGNTGTATFTFTNNTVHDVRLPRAGSVTLSCTSSSVSNNYFYNISGAGILTADSSTGCAVTNQTIANNFLLNTCVWNGAQPGGGDCGAIYSLLPNHSNSNIAFTNNYIRDVNTVSNGAGVYQNCCAIGIYLDGNTYNVSITGNVITGIKSSCIYFHGGGLQATGNLCDVSTPANGPQFVLTDDVEEGNDITGGNLLENNIVVGNNPGTLPPEPWGVFFDQVFSTGLYNPATITNNAYYNYGGTAINSTGSRSMDTNPVYENPQLSCWAVGVATGSPVFNSPVSFPGIKGGWGPPGFVIPQTGTAPSWPHGC